MPLPLPLAGADGRAARRFLADGRAFFFATGAGVRPEMWSTISTEDWRQHGLKGAAHLVADMYLALVLDAQPEVSPVLFVFLLAFLPGILHSVVLRPLRAASQTRNLPPDDVAAFSRARPHLEPHSGPLPPGNRVGQDIEQRVQEHERVADRSPQREKPQLSRALVQHEAARTRKQRPELGAPRHEQRRPRVAGVRRVLPPRALPLQDLVWRLFWPRGRWWGRGKRGLQLDHVAPSGWRHGFTLWTDRRVVVTKRSEIPLRAGIAVIAAAARVEAAVILN